MALDRDPEHVPRLALVPVGRRPDADHTRHRLVLVQPDLQPHARRTFLQREQVVADREALRLQFGQHLQSLRHRQVEVAPGRRADVAGDAFAAPAEVVGRRDVREETEVQLVAQVRGRFDELRRLDDNRHLAVLFLHPDEAGDLLPVGHVATDRRSYAGGMPACTASWRRMIPSISASGRGGQNGTYTSTGTILSTPCSTV